MIDNAFGWAERNGRLRKNEVHGEEEAKLILDETFNYKDKTGQETNQEANMAVEDSWMHIYLYICYKFVTRCHSIVIIYQLLAIKDEDGNFFDDAIGSISDNSAWLSLVENGGEGLTAEDQAANNSVSFKCPVCIILKLVATW